MNAYILKLWHQGNNTALIAQMARLSEAEVYRIIATEQDRRHSEKNAGRAA